MAENDNDKTVTAVEYLENQLALEKEAAEILPGKFENCTFKLGPIRQAVYACKTCSDLDPAHPAGMCYGCSIACHADHEVLELFPKRNFRCDCGLPDKFGGYTCHLDMDSKESARNEDNSYNHNFVGSYCRCNIQYDPEKEEGTMYQCVLCEDWFHDTCIGKVPSTDEWDDYICRECIAKYPFVVNVSDKRFILGIVEEDKVKQVLDQKRGLQNVDHLLAKSTLNDNEIGKRKMEDGTHANTGKKSKLEDGSAIIPDSGYSTANSRKEKHVDKFSNKIDLFLREGWREGLCRCDKCTHAYFDNHISFLLSGEKTYEPEEDEDAGSSIFEEGMKQLMRMDRVKAIESTIAYNTMASQIKEFLSDFKDTNKTVTKQDIEGFFARKLQERREQQK
ncbi:hypothetical protein INT43_004750 [Umbelopsis isabellina]|uniref:UBR-type domain-containing protein n=1 Tax=Mortierella isabellina TaxID=91625 RepID=A0A8H7UA74_MORIS|nr:hypothetical protein INT43_004750 [Umbelopsis isabellina]